MEGAVDMNLSESADDGHSFLDMELEALQSIYINELKVDTNENCTTVSIDLHPATADKLDEQYVRMTLQFILKEQYPEEIPEIKIRNPRGLSEEKISCIEKDLLAIAETKKGSSMLFEMIDAAKEHLTIGNRPSEECAICLYGFSDNDLFTKTECYHYFHSHCLARYARNFIENSKDCEDGVKSEEISNELLCPMCRITIQFNEIDADYPPPEESDDSKFILSDEMLELQKKMADLYQKQVDQGGIIDIEAEKNKYLLEISNVPTRVNNEEKPEQKAVDVAPSTTEHKTEEPEEVNSPVNERKDVRDRNQRFDHKGRYRNLNRPNENRGNYRSDYRYNKRDNYRNPSSDNYRNPSSDNYRNPSSDNYHGNFNRNRYGKQNSASSHRKFKESDLPHDDDVDAGEHSELNESENNTQDVHDDLSENSEQVSQDSKSRQNSNFSPRYNRGSRRGGNHYGYHSNNRQYNKSSYRDRNSSHTSHRSNTVQEEEESSANLEERAEKDFRTYDNNDRRGNFRPNNFKRDDDYNSRQRYPDNRNSQRGYKGAYGRRENYSQSQNNYSRDNRYGDFRDRDQYQTDRDRNFRGRRNYKDGKYQAGNDNSYDRHNKYGAKNYTENRPGRYSGRSYTESSNNESESVKVNNQNSDHKASAEKDTCVKKHLESSERETESLGVKSEACLAKKCSDKLTDSIPAFEKNGSNASNEILLVGSRTVNPPPGFANPLKKVIYGLQGANPPPGFNKS